MRPPACQLIFDPPSCGPGLPAIVCATLGAASVVATDYVPRVLELAAKNVACNGASATVSVACLDWTAPMDPAWYHAFDVLVAADVIYDPWHAAAVLAVIRHTLRPGGTANGGSFLCRVHLSGSW